MPKMRHEARPCKKIIPLNKTNHLAELFGPKSKTKKP